MVIDAGKVPRRRMLAVAWASLGVGLAAGTYIQIHAWPWWSALAGVVVVALVIAAVVEML